MSDLFGDLKPSKGNDLFEGLSDTQGQQQPQQPIEEIGGLESAGRNFGIQAGRFGRFAMKTAGALVGAAEKSYSNILGNNNVEGDAYTPLADGMIQMGQKIYEDNQKEYGLKPNEVLTSSGKVGEFVGSVAPHVMTLGALTPGIEAQERYEELENRGATANEALGGSATTGAVGIVSNLLPLGAGKWIGKSGGKKLAEKGFEKTGQILQSKTGQVLAGGAGGAAINAPIEAGGAAIENATLPEGKQFQDLKKEVKPTAGGTAMGAVFGALHAPHAGAPKPKIAEQSFKEAAKQNDFKPAGEGEFTTPSGDTITPEQWDNASDRVRKGWTSKPPEEAANEKAPAQEAPEAKPEFSPRAVELARLREKATNPEVVKHLDKEIEAEHQKKDDLKQGEEFANLAKATDDPALRDELSKKATKLGYEEPAPEGHEELYKAAKETETPTIGKEPDVIAKEVDAAQHENWKTKHDLSDEEATQAERIHEAMKVDEAAVERAAIQHENNEPDFHKEIERIISERPNEKAPAGGKGEAEQVRGEPGQNAVQGPEAEGGGANPIRNEQGGEPAVGRSGVESAPGGHERRGERAGTAGTVRRPFRNVEESHRRTVMQRAKEAGVPLTHEQAEKIAPIKRDVLTGFHTAEQRIPAIERARIHAEKTGEPAHYMEIDIRNQGALNKKFGHSGADKHLRAMTDIVAEEIKKTGGDVDFTRHGGDEVSAVIVNADRAAVEAAGARAKERTLEYAKEHGLSDLEHPKYPGQKEHAGTGISYGVSEINNRRTEDILSEADKRVEQEKLKGNTNVNGEKTEAPRPVAPEGQAKGVAGRVEQKRAAGREEIKKPEGKAAEEAAAKGGEKVTKESPPLTKEAANRIAKSFTAQGTPTKAVEHPTKKGMYTLTDIDSLRATGESKPIGSQAAAELRLREDFGGHIIDNLLRSGILKLSKGAEYPAETVRKQNVRALSREGGEGGSGVHLFWDRLPAKDMAGALMHELGEHFGMIRMLGKPKYDALLRELKTSYKSGDKEVKAAWDSVKRRYVDNGADTGILEGDQRFMREVAARLVESAPKRGSVQRLLDAVRSWLYRKFGKGNITPDLIRGLATSALRKAAAGELGREKTTMLFAEGQRKAFEAAQANREEFQMGEKNKREDISPLGFYSALSRGIEKATSKTQPAAGWSAFIKGLTTKGVKPDEIEWSGINDWLKLQGAKVSKDDVLNYLKNNGVKVEEKTLSGGKDRLMAGAFGEPSPTKFHEHQLPGGKNYRELLLTLPRDLSAEHESRERRINEYQSRIDELSSLEQTADVRRQIRNTETQISMVHAETDTPGGFRSSHFKEPNILAHIRMNDRVDADGKKVLFIEELQSDWGQQGKKKGFKGTTQEDAKKFFGINDDNWAKASEQDREAYRDEMVNSEGRDIVNQGPFVSKTEAWTSLALKRAIDYAAKNGYDKVAWTNGEQQSSRYDLSNQIDSIKFSKMPDGDIFWNAIKDGERVTGGNNKPSELENIIGKEPAKKILERADKGPGELSGLDLEIGGEGMRAYYDKIVPNTANDVLRKIGGGKIRDIDISIPSEREGKYGFGFEPQDARVIQRGDIFQVLAKNPTSGVEQVRGGNFDTKAEAEAYAKNGGVASRAQSGFDITHEMRNRVIEEGQPMFQLGGEPEHEPPTSKGIGTGHVSSKARNVVSSVMEYINRGFYDNLEQLYKAQKDLRKPLSDAANAYDSEIASHGRKRERIKDVIDNYVNPIHEIAAKEKLTQQDVSDYLYAKHAPEANKYIETIRDGFKNGSGMSDAHARGIIDSFSTEQKTALEKISSLVQDMRKASLDKRVEDGLVSDETRKELLERFPNWVSLKNFDDDSMMSGSKVGGTGPGLEVKGKEFKARSGRVSKAEDPLSMTINDAMMAIVRSESNRVAQAVHQLVKENPTDAWEKVTDENYPKRKDRNSEGKVVEVKDPTALMHDPHYFGAKFNGEQQWIKIKSDKLARQLAKMGEHGFPDNAFGDVMKAVNIFTHTFARVHTQLSPDFTLMNMLRDVQEAALNTTAFSKEKGGELAAKTMKNLPSSLKASAKVNLGELFGKKFSDDDALLYKQAALDGTFTSGYGLMGAQEIQSMLRRTIKAASGDKLAKTIVTTEKIFKPIEKLNDSFENMTRFAVYKAALDAGFTRQQAAVMGKKSTLNFDKRGEASIYANTIWAFFNAGCQGTKAFFIGARDSNYVRGAIAAIFAAGLAEPWTGEEDETGTNKKDVASEFKRDRTIPFLAGTKVVAMPLAQGLTIPYMAGRHISRVMQGRQSVADAVGDILGGMWNTYFPVNTLAPTVIAPLVEASNNKDFANRKIAKQNEFDTYTPASSQYRENANEAIVAFAKALNQLGGGTETKKSPVGFMDLSPEKMQYVFKQYMGGLAMPFELANTALSSKEMKDEDYPVWRRFVIGEKEDFRHNQAAKITKEADHRHKEIQSGEEVPGDEIGHVDSIRSMESDIRSLTKDRNLAKKAGNDTSSIDERLDELYKRVVTSDNEFKKAQRQ